MMATGEPAHLQDNLPQEQNPWRSNIRPNHYADISADGRARQHNGNIYNTNTNHYTIRQRHSDEALRENDLNKAFLKAASEGQTRRLEILYQRGANADFKDECGLTALHYACHSGVEDVVESLIHMGVDINALSDRFGTPLCLAALRGRQKIVDILLDKRANMYTNGGLVGSVLHAASFGGSIAIVEKLLNSGFNIRTSRRYCLFLMQEALLGRFNQTDLSFYAEGEALHVATGSGEEAVLNLLLSKGAQVDAAWRSWVVLDGGIRDFEDASPTQRVERDTALILAASQDLWSILHVLLHAGASRDFQHSHGMTALMEAAYRGHARCASSLIDGGANLSAKGRHGYTAVMCAVQQGHIEILKILLDAGAPLNCRNEVGNTAFVVAALNNQVACLEELVVRGVHPGQRENEEIRPTPLHWATRYGHVDAVNFLLDNGASLEARALERMITVLALAAMHGHTHCVQVLIVRGADVESRDNTYGFTPLHWAAANGHAASITALLDAGAQANTIDNFEYTPLHRALLESRVPAVHALLEGGADSQFTDNDEFTPLHWAAQLGNIEILQALINAGADINARTSFQATPMMEAAFEGHLQVVEELLKLGADPSLQDDEGETALVLAEKNDHVDIVSVLQVATSEAPQPANPSPNTQKRKINGQRRTRRKSTKQGQKTLSKDSSQANLGTSTRNGDSSSGRRKRAAGWFW